MKRKSPFLQQKSDELMKTMRRKSIKASHHCPTTTGSTIITTGSTTTTTNTTSTSLALTTRGDNRPMIILLDLLKSEGLIYSSASSLLIDTMELPSYDFSSYLSLTSLQTLWFSQRTAVEFVKSREDDRDGVGCRGGLLCDDMGLGKSKVVLTSIMEYNQKQCISTKRRFNGPTLIVCPPMLVDGWVDEVEQFPPSTFFYRAIRSTKDLEKINLFQLKNCCDITITTYPIIASFFESNDGIFSLDWLRIVADEGQTFVNESTTNARAMMALRATHKWIISGTPVQNRSTDMMTLLRYIGLPLSSTMDRKAVGELIDKVMLMRNREDIIKQQRIHHPEHCIPELKSVTRKVQLVTFRTIAEKVLYYSYANFALLRRISPSHARYKKLGPTPTVIQLMRQLCTSPFIVNGLVVPDGLLLLERGNTEEQIPYLFSPRPRKQIVPNSLAQFVDEQPRAFHLSHQCGPSYNKDDPLYHSSIESVEEQFVWDPYAKKEAVGFDLNLEKDREDYTLLYRELVKSVEEGVAWEMTEKMCEVGPIEKTESMINHLLGRVLRMDRPSSKEQAIVDYISETPLEDKIIVYSFYTGILKGVERALILSGIESIIITGKTKHNAELLRRFKEDPSIKVLLITLKLGNYGLNIPVANHVLVADPWWNPYVMEQAEARVKRVGQLKDIYVVYFIMDNTLELCIMNLTIRKKGILRSFLEPSNDCPATITDEEATLLFNYNISITPI